MAEKGLNFIEYDEQFRKERASQAKAGIEPWEWNVFRQDTYNNIQLNAIAEKLQLSGKRWFDTPRFQYHSNSHIYQFPSNQRGQFGGGIRRPWNFQQNFQQNSHQFDQQFSRVPFGFCFDYHALGKRCLKTNCNYRHFCPCGRGPHTLFSCRSAGVPFARRPGPPIQGQPRRFDAYHPRQQ